MSDLTPETRTENFWVNEGNLEPITRKEQYIKHLYDETQVVPDHPVTREEYFINKAGEELHDVTVEQLSVTENGTYSEAGKAYSPVIVEVPDPVLKTKSITENGTYDASEDSADGYSSVSVNVPLPQNAYLLKSIANLPQAIASFNDGQDMVMPSLKVAIEPQQEGSGDPSPSNVRPISGWDEVNVNRAKVYQICEPSDSTEITANGVTMTYLGKGKYRVKGTFTTNEYTSLNLPIVPFTIYGGDDCYIKLNNSVGLSGVSIIFKNNTSEVDSWGLYPSNRSDSYVGMRNKYTNNITIEISRSGYGTNFDFTFKVEILSNSTANLSTYNISFGSAGTVYGGTLDVVSGVMTVDKEYVDLGTLNYSYYSGNLFMTPISNLKPVPNTRLCNALCSIYVAKQGNEYASIDGSFVAGFNNARTLAIHDSRFTDATAFKQAMNGVQLVYELATPLTIQLTPTAVKSLRGVNNVYANTGDIKDAEYFSKEV